MLFEVKRDRSQHNTAGRKFRMKLELRTFQRTSPTALAKKKTCKVKLNKSTTSRWDTNTNFSVFPHPNERDPAGRTNVGWLVFRGDLTRVDRVIYHWACAFHRRSIKPWRQMSRRKVSDYWESASASGVFLVSHRCRTAPTLAVAFWLRW